MPSLTHHPALALWALWPIWSATWMLAALWASPAARRPGTPAERRAVLLVVLGFVLLFVEPPGVTPPFGRLWQVPFPLAWAMVAMTAAGFALCWWARLHLGRLWSFQTTTKADHRIVDTGPYAFARHPIYSGILLAALARAVQAGTPLAILGFAVLAVAFWLKAAVEEDFLAAQLGPEAYRAYAGRVRRLVPFLF